MLIQFIAFALVAAVSPMLIEGVRVKDFGTAMLVSLVFGLLNIVIGWLLALLVTLVSIPFVLVTFGLFTILIPSIVNMFLLKASDAMLEGFELDGLVPALLMGILFAITGAFV